MAKPYGCYNDINLFTCICGDFKVAIKWYNEVDKFLFNSHKGCPLIPVTAD